MREGERRPVNRTVVVGVFVVALAAGGAAFRPVEPAAEVRALVAPPAAVDDTAPEPAGQARGERLLRQAGVRLRDAYSVRMAADVKQGARHVRTDLGLDHHGNCSGTVDSGEGVVADLVFLKGGADTDGDGEGDGQDEAYLKYSDASLDQMEEKAEALGPELGARARTLTALARGKYVKVPTGPKGARAIGLQCGVGRILAARMAGHAAGTRALPVVRRDGERLVPLRPPGDSGAGNATAYVVADGDAYLRSVSGTSGDMRIAVTFTDYDKPFQVDRPDPARVVVPPAGEGTLFEV
ncbi:hypothetical protein [Streptomyces sp. NPDC046939]|uniref:hypothetical protein n=1 Tax=Streptomyces sp. NPDC046939 TaxID=3155376 RepID=UPI0033E8304E